MGRFIDAKVPEHQTYPEGTMLYEMCKEFQPFHATPIVAAKVDGVLKDLQTPIYAFDTIEFVDMTSESGSKTYQRSVVFLLITAVDALFAGAEITVEHSINKGLYCELYLGRPLKMEDVAALEEAMRTMIRENRAIVKKNLPKQEAIALFQQQGRTEKSNLIASLDRDSVSIYYCGAFYDYLYGPMLLSTGGLGLFALDYHAAGVILRVPERENPLQIPDFAAQPKLSKIFDEAENWAKILHCKYVLNLNAQQKNGTIGDMIRVSEALHEKKIAQIADFIAANISELRLILIAGPSSSGKTTFAQRMRIQLRVNGIDPASISLDDYFQELASIPRNEKGAYDYETLEAIDVKLFNTHLLELMRGNTVEIPYYNFITSKREYRGNLIRLDKNQPLIVEGIHGLNEKLTASIPRRAKYKIYISALTQLAIDGHNRIPTTVTRLIRRMVRDHQFRGSNATKTIRQWPNVRSGEEKNIFPYQEDADVMFNSALIYELGVLKGYAKPLLEAVDVLADEYTDAVQLLDFLAYFDEIKADAEIPVNSILKEFIGQSCFFR